MKQSLIFVSTGLLICLWSVSAWAQATAQISGTVRDQSGAVLPGVEVTATQTDTDVQVVNITSVAETPKFSSTALRLLGGGWRLSGIYRYLTGGYFTLTSGLDRALSGIASQRPDQVLASPYGNGSLNNYLNPAAFAHQIWERLELWVPVISQDRRFGDSTLHCREPSRSGSTNGSNFELRLTT